MLIFLACFSGLVALSCWSRWFCCSLGLREQGAVLELSLVLDAPSCSAVVHWLLKIHRAYPVLSCSVSSCSVEDDELYVGLVLTLLCAADLGTTGYSDLATGTCYLSSRAINNSVLHFLPTVMSVFKCSIMCLLHAAWVGICFTDLVVTPSCFPMFCHAKNQYWI